MNEKTPLQEAIESRGRPARIVHLQFLSGGSGDGLVAIRVPTLREEIRAQLQSAQWLQEDSRGVPAESMRHLDLASVWLVYDCFRQPKPRNPERPNMLDTAFPTPEWMVHNLTADQLNRLVDLLDETRAELGQDDSAGTDEEYAEHFEALLKLDEDGAAEMLADKGRVWLIGALVQLAGKSRNTGFF